jgi:hypothetical protein
MPWTLAGVSASIASQFYIQMNQQTIHDTRLLRRVNHLNPVNIQTKHITRVVHAFLAAAVPVNIVRRFMMSGSCLIKNGGQILCTVRPDQAKQLPIPLPLCFGGIADPDNDNSDSEEEQAYLEECAGLPYDLNLPGGKDTLQIHSTRFAFM